MAVIMLVRPGPAVTKANALELLSESSSLKYSAAIPALTSWTMGIHLNFVLAELRRCIIFPPATKKQWV
jgi:hypothetical protein